MSTNGNGTTQTQQLEAIARAATATTPGGAVVEDFLSRVEGAAHLLTEVAKELGNIGEEDESAILADADALRGQMRQIVGRLLARKRRELGDLERILGKIAG